MNMRGFTFIEIMVVVAVVLVLSAIAVWSLGAMNERLLLRAAMSDVAFALEAAKARAVAGTGGEPHGVNFEADHFTEFSGNSFNVDDEGNVVHALDDRVGLSTDILQSEESVIFSRLSGAIDEAVTITVYLIDDPDMNKTIVIGPGGDISYGE